MQQRKLPKQQPSRKKTSNLGHVNVVRRVINEYLSQYLTVDSTSLQANAPLLVAVSGGVDSCVLMHALLTAFDKKKHCNRRQKMHFFYGDHGVRSKRAIAQDLRCIRKIIDGVGDGSATLHIAQRSAVTEKRMDVSEASMRNWRYQQLQYYADAIQAKIIVTAHHWDDNLETGLIKLLRGTSVQSFSLMSKRGRFPLPSSSLIIDRPFLEIKKSQLQSYADYFRIAFSEDITNNNRQYLRNAVRLDIVPLLERVRPGASEKIHELFSELSGATPPTESKVIIGGEWSGNLLTTSYQSFEDHIRKVVAATGHHLKRAHFNELKNSYLKGLASKQKRTILLPGNIVVTIDAFCIILTES